MVLTKSTESVATKFRTKADLLQKQIDHLRRDRKTNTPKRLREAESALQDARQLERLQDKLRSLADHRENLTLPVELAGVTTLNVVEWLCDYDRYPTGYAHGTYTVNLAKAGITPDNYAAAKQAFEALGSPNAGQKSAADLLLEREREIALMKIPGFFPTPPALIEQMLALVAVEPGERVLEPSAGKGNIADAIRQEFPNAMLDVVEQHATLQAMLRLKQHKLIATDCFELHDPIYDVIYANPPFERGTDIDHVQHYFTLLKPGGVLVSVMSAGAFSRGDKKAREFQDWLNDHGYSVEVEPGAFKNAERTTGVEVRLVVIEKTCQDDEPEFIWGDGRPMTASELDDWQKVNTVYRAIATLPSHCGFAIGERVGIQWGSSASTTARIVRFGESNADWVTVEDEQPRTISSNSFTIAINALTKLTAIVPVTHAQTHDIVWNAPNPTFVSLEPVFVPGDAIRHNGRLGVIRQRVVLADGIAYTGRYTDRPETFLVHPNELTLLHDIIKPVPLFDGTERVQPYIEYPPIDAPLIEWARWFISFHFNLTDDEIRQSPGASYDNGIIEIALNGMALGDCDYVPDRMIGVRRRKDVEKFMLCDLLTGELPAFERLLDDLLADAEDRATNYEQYMREIVEDYADIVTADSLRRVLAGDDQAHLRLALGMIGILMDGDFKTDLRHFAYYAEDVNDDVAEAARWSLEAIDPHFAFSADFLRALSRYAAHVLAKGDIPVKGKHQLKPTQQAVPTQMSLWA